MNKNGKVLLVVIVLIMILTLLISRLLTSSVLELVKVRKTSDNQINELIQDSLIRKLKKSIDGSRKIEEIVSEVFTSYTKNEAKYYLHEDRAIENLKQSDLAYQWNEEDMNYIEMDLLCNIDSANEKKLIYQIHIMKEYNRNFEVYHIYIRSNNCMYYLIEKNSNTYEIIRKGFTKWIFG